MLILGRQAGESLDIGSDIHITVLSVEGGRVRLAITAPKDVPIVRCELLEAAAANLDASHEEAEPGALLEMMGSVLESGRKKQPQSDLNNKE